MLLLFLVLVAVRAGVHCTTKEMGPQAYRAAYMETLEAQASAVQQKSDARLQAFIDRHAICLTRLTYISLFRWEAPLDVINASVQRLQAQGWSMRLEQRVATGYHYGRRDDTGARVCSAETLHGDGPVAKACFRSININGDVVDNLYYETEQPGLFDSDPCTVKRTIDAIRVEM